MTEEVLIEASDRQVPAAFEDLVNRIAEIDERIGDLNAEIDLLKTERGLHEEKALEIFAERGIQNVKLAARARTVYLHRSIYASVVGERSDDFLLALDAEGLGDLAKRSIHPSRLVALVREWREQNNDELPESFRDLVNHGERYSVRSRKS